jgi:RNA recognition motif-containing protein
VTIVREQDTGLSRGYGFVEFENEADMRSTLSSRDGHNTTRIAPRVF